MGKRISGAELDVMDVLWDMQANGKASMLATEIIAKLNPQKNWSPRTVKTLLGRLVEKNVISHTPDGRRYLYYPLITRESHARGAISRLTERLFGGRVAPLVANFAEGKGLTEEDIKDLEVLLAELKNER